MGLLTLLENEPVEWKMLGEFCDIKRGRVISKKYLEENKGEYPVFSSQTRDNGVIGKIDTYDFDGDYITWTTDGAYAGTVFYRSGKFSITNICGLIKTSELVLMKYVYYWLQIEAKKYVTGGSGNPKLMSNVVAKIRVPIPSLDIQEKIVKILDKFTEYVTELQTELQKRIDQYTYYRDILLSEEYIQKLCKEMEADRQLRIVSLGEIGIFTRGNGLQKKDFQEKGKPVIHYGQLYTKYGFSTDNVVSYTDKTVFEKLRKVYKNDILIATTSENIEDVGKCLVWLGDEEVGFSGDMYSYRTDENAKYIAYYFQSAQFQKQKERIANGTKVIRIHSDDMKKIEIPLPPLSLQHKIVTILDKFQTMIEESKGLLPAEIEQRQQQYEYYREKLLTFNGECDSTHARTLTISDDYYGILREVAKIVDVDIEDKIRWCKISEFCIRQQGIAITAKEMKALHSDLGEVKVFAGGNTFAYIAIDNLDSNRIISKPSIIVKSRGNIDFEYYDGQFTHKNEMWSYSTDDNNQIKFVYYFMKKHVDYFRSKAISGKLPQISTGITDNFVIPLPPLHVQQRIVSILDTFNTLVHDMQEGLPKEIKLRQQQYEYYRERLLSFPKASQG